MFPRPYPVRTLLALACVATILLITGADRSGAEKDAAAPSALAHGAHGSHEEMSEEEMQAFVDAWFAVNPRVGTFAQGVPAITFRAFSNKFDYDSDLVGTPIDSVVIGVGDIVQWQRLIGAHTVTNGLSSIDPGNGTVFDVPLDAANPVFQHMYDTPGVFPFFCRTHEDFQMVGVVTVIGATPTERASWGEVKARSR